LLDLDSEMPATSALWTLPPTLTAKSVNFKRAGGSFTGKGVGLIHDTGALCGDFPPIFAAAVVCP
jgi:hypothetical protein